MSQGMRPWGKLKGLPQFCGHSEIWKRLWAVPSHWIFLRKPGHVLFSISWVVIEWWDWDYYCSILFFWVSFSTHICNMRVSLTQPLIDLYTLKPFSGETYQFRCDVWRSINFGFNMIENSWRLKLLGSFRELGFPNPIFNRQVVRFHQMKQGNKNSSAAKFVL